MHLIEKNRISLTPQKETGQPGEAARSVLTLVQKNDGSIIHAGIAGSCQPEVGMVIAQVRLPHPAEVADGDLGEMVLYGVSQVMPGIAALGTCRRCNNAVRGLAGSKRVIFCKAQPVYGACGNYGFVPAIVDDCPRYEDSPVNGQIFDTEILQVMALEYQSGGWRLGPAEAAATGEQFLPYLG